MSSLQRVTAALLVGGLGTRLRSAVPHFPKVLAPVAGRPYVTYLLDQLSDAGVAEVVLLAGYRADELHQLLGNWYGDLPLVYSVEPQPLGTAGAVRWALDKLHARTVLLLNGDSYCDVNFHDFSTAHERQSATASLVLTHVDDASRFGRVVVDARQRVGGFEEKGHSGPGWVNAGIYLIDRTLFEEIPPGVPRSLERDLLPDWIARGSVFGFPTQGGFLDIGTPDSYAAANEYFREAVPPC